MVYLLRKNGALVKAFTDPLQCEDWMKANRKNGEYWRIQAMKTEPHQTKE